MTAKRERLTDLQAGANFIPRHIGPRETDISSMLKTVGAGSLDDLIEKVIPANIRMDGLLNLPEALSERNTLSDLRQVAGRNQAFTSMIGMGYYGCVTPKVVLRRLLESPGWYTAYTPYQAEVSQGRLEALMNYQQMVCDLTGLDLANASLLDEGTAVAEAISMAKRVSKSKNLAFFLDEDTHPQTIAVAETRAEAFGYELIIGNPSTDLVPEDVFAAVLSYPGSSGQVNDFSKITESLKAAGAISIFATDLLALALLKSPGEMGADIAVGSSQRFGVPMGYGGPHAAFFATRDEYKRSIPGRIIGVSIDANGKSAYRMALQTREQHIRRDKATSNICTAQVLLAVIRRNTVSLIPLRCMPLVVPMQFLQRLKRRRSIFALVDGDHLGISLDQTTRRSELEKLLACFNRNAMSGRTIDQADGEVVECIPKPLQRTSEFMTHPVFQLYHSETELLRYLRQLQAKDIALDRSMIPLGSCTMKLNGTTEMIPITWREFAHMHPFVPLEQAQGYQQLFEDFEAMLCEITGFDAVSLQPNAGSQGEYAGLLTIRAYHRHNGDDHRNICLIPTSAHGTNPASAVMAGLKVVAVRCDEAGNVDVDDLKAKAAEHKENLAALMITYPSTHGVFESAIREICDAIHENGGQVYLDGANLNALVGIVQPGKIGADVCHMNLHKTFCIPHGGGGPGIGPIGVGAHLAKFLPDHVLVTGVNPASGGEKTIGQVASAPWGSASILPISWAYIAMMGNAGLKRATQVAILNANYIAARLSKYFPVLYSGPGGYVAHECILDMRNLKENLGITVEDVAKRLVDYGYHAPTMSFPVVETMMVEPTESESKQEIDRFCDAMIAIAMEIDEIRDGKVEADNNLLSNAPHTQDLLMGDWDRPYSKERAFFPLPYVSDDKYWPPVGRVDNVHGDRNLVCACPPMEAYMEAAE
ncbi:Glycine dehydrogenase (decarboxylating) [Nymphon striatum]|nr:Glycine dehydrogenase (decarboxylating) [Nymphon striatum]